MNNQILRYHEQHLKNYKKAVIELISNNTNRFVEEDVLPFFRKPPLDSMDIIKTKFISLAKENHLILETEVLEQLLNNYRLLIGKQVKSLKDKRLDSYCKVVSNFEESEKNKVIKITIKQTKQISKDLLKDWKEILRKSLDDTILSKSFETVNQTKSAIPLPVLEYFNQQIKDFLENKYLEQVIEGIRLKLVFRDNTLVNGVKEQGTRYLFTKKNSHLLNAL